MSKKTLLQVGTIINFTRCEYADYHMVKTAQVVKKFNYKTQETLFRKKNKNIVLISEQEAFIKFLVTKELIVLLETIEINIGYDMDTLSIRY